MEIFTWANICSNIAVRIVSGAHLPRAEGETNQRGTLLMTELKRQVALS